MKKRSEILMAASDLICGDRHEEHGDAELTMGRVAEFWTSYTGMKITAADACAMMTLLKLARFADKPSTENLKDGIGYLALADEVAKYCRTQ